MHEIKKKSTQNVVVSCQSNCCWNQNRPTLIHWVEKFERVHAHSHSRLCDETTHITNVRARVCVSVVQNLNRPKNVRFLGWVCVCVCVCLPWPTTTRRRTPGYLDVCVFECVGNTNVLGVFLKWRNWVFFLLFFCAFFTI